MDTKAYDEKKKGLMFDWEKVKKAYHPKQFHAHGIFDQDVPAWLVPETLGEDHARTDLAIEIAGFLTFMKRARVESGVVGIFGPPGSGKSSIAREIASILNLPYLNVALSGDTICSELLGATELVGGETKFVPSPMAEIIAYGGVLELAEINLPRVDALSALNSILDFNQVLTLPNGQTLKRHPLSFIVATINLDLEGTKDMNEALKDRIQPFYEVQFPKKELLTEILRKNLKGVSMKTLVQPYGDETVLDKMVECFLEARSTREGLGEDLQNHLTVRWLISWAKMSEYLGSVHEASRRVLASGCNFDRQLMRHVAGQIDHYFGGDEGECLNEDLSI